MASLYLVQGQTTHSAALLLLLDYIKPRAIIMITPLHHHQQMLLCGMFPVNRWCHNHTPYTHAQVASSSNENRCRGLLTGAQVFALSVGAQFRAACRKHELFTDLHQSQGNSKKERKYEGKHDNNKYGMKTEYIEVSFDPRRDIHNMYGHSQ